MADPAEGDVERFFEGCPLGRDAYRTVLVFLRGLGEVEVRITKSQVAFRRRKGFAWLWLPGRWLRDPGADVVLSIALGEADPSPRFKQVVHPAPTVWMHHLELHALEDLDDEVEGWLGRAFERA